MVNIEFLVNHVFLLKQLLQNYENELDDEMSFVLHVHRTVREFQHLLPDGNVCVEPCEVVSQTMFIFVDLQSTGDLDA